MADKPTVVTTQTNFSSGELDKEAKRGADNPVQKYGMRQLSNFRLLETLGFTNRPGRRLLVFEAGRTDEINLAPGFTFLFAFAEGSLRIYLKANLFLAFNVPSGFPWTLSTVQNLVVDTYQKQIFIANPGHQIVIITWDGVVGFTFTSLVETVTAGGQKRTLFYRLAAPGITLLPSGATGAIGIQTSAPYFVAGMIGTRIRYQGRQITITGIVDSQNAAATVNEPLLGGMRLTVSSTINFHVGDVVQGTVSGATGQIAAIGVATLDVVLLTDTIFQQADIIVGPTASSSSTLAPAAIAPPASVVWDEEIMNDFRGWPQSVFCDQNRLGLCDFPALPSAVAWSAVAAVTDFYVGALPTNAILELAPNNSRIFYVLAGPESNEIVFGDNRVYYITISPTNPLVPGSVSFNQISAGGVQQVQPRAIDEIIVFIQSGGIGVGGIFVLGAYNRPYRTDWLSSMNAHLFNDPQAIAIPAGNEGFTERYLYVLNGDGTVVVGKYSVSGGQVKDATGWVPWSGAGTVTWISAYQSDVLFTTSYPVSPLNATSAVELQDSTLYLDEATLVNPAPRAIQAPISPGTPIGDMTGNGGLAAAFNNAATGFQSAGQSAAANFSVGYIGRAFNVPQTLGQVVVYPSFDFGFAAFGSGPVTIELRAKHTPPTSYNDGTLLASVTVENETSAPVVLSPPYDTTRWEFGFINIQRTGATVVICSQCVLQSGPAWWIAGGSIELMDQGWRMMGTYQVDINGQIVPQNRGGENLASPSLVVGQKWTAIAEPFIPPAGAGQNVGQRTWSRRLTDFVVSVMDSSGFVLSTLFSGPITPSSPALGTVMSEQRFPAWNVGDNPLLPPPLR